MKPSTQFFIDTVMDKIDFCFVDSRNYEGAQQYLLDEIEDYDGSNIVVSFEAKGNGMVVVEVFNEEKSADEKLIVLEDNLDVEFVTSEINKMIQDVMQEDEDEQTDEIEHTDEPIDYNEKLNFENIYNSSLEASKPEQVLCKAYLDKDDSVLLVFDEKSDDLGDLLCYAHVGQHSSCDPYYPDELEALSAKDPRVKELVEEYENLGSEKVELVLMPVDELLPIQKDYHKEIKSGD